MSGTGDLQWLRRKWDKHASSYDRQMEFWERKLLADTRSWICRQARGEVLEVAIGTGLNLDHYPAEVAVTGVDLSPQMLARARDRAERRGRDVRLYEGDAQQLQLPDESFDSVVCTFSLCAIPDDRQAVAEMVRVLRPGGTLLLADHVVSSAWPVRVLQRVLEVVSIPLGGERLRRRPIRHVWDAGLTIQRHDRFKLGIVERFAATRPGP